MFLQVRSSGSSHEEARLEKGKLQPRRKKRGKFGKKKNKCRLPTSLLVELSQSRVAGVCSSQSMPFCTILKPSASGTSLWRKALWKVVCCNEKGQNHGMGKTFFLRRTHTKKTKKKQKKRHTQTKRVNDLYVWCMMFLGDISQTADTLVLYKTVWGKHVCTVNVWDRLTGPPGRRGRGEGFFFWSWIDGWCGAGTDVAVDWMGFWEEFVFPRWQCEDGAGWKFLPVCLAPRGWGGLGSFQSFWRLGFDFIEGGRVPLLVSDPKHPPTPPTRSLYDRSFFGVFGAATKCAMCYVAWFIIFLQATKLYL